MLHQIYNKIGNPYTLYHNLLLITAQEHIADAGRKAGAVVRLRGALADTGNSVG